MRVVSGTNDITKSFCIDFSILSFGSSESSSNIADIKVEISLWNKNHRSKVHRSFDGAVFSLTSQNGS